MTSKGRMIYLYLPYREAEIKVAEQNLAHRCCGGSWNLWIDAANTAKYAAALWVKARGSSDFRSAVKKAQAFSDGARAAARVAKAIGNYEPMRNYDPKMEFLEYSRKLHL